MTFLAQAAEWQAALVGIVALVLGGGIGYAVAHFVAVRKARQAESEGERTVSKARADADAILKEARVTAKEEAIRAREAFEKETARTREELRERERLVAKHEDGIDAKMETLARKEKAVEAGYTQVADMEKSLKAKHADLDQKIADEKRTLFKVAGLDQNQARQMLLERMEGEVQHEAAALIQRVTEHAQEESEQKARQILAGAIQRLASDYTAEVTVATVDIPSDEMKGRIIGREGRNIRALETLTGIDFIIDDTPSAVILSGFDGVRREVARITLERLLQDGRIHPAKIEEAYYQAREQIATRIVEVGEQAVYDAKVGPVHAELGKLLGRLRYRTSYGQNVLAHSVECAHLAALIAAELGASTKTARRAALLHDVGKAVSQEFDGPHALVGGELARRYGESEAVAHAMEAHHNEVEMQTIEAVIVQVADSLSGARPGARGEALEQYVKRLRDLEAIAVRDPGVEKVYAMQAGREIRVIVKPEHVDDDAAALISHKIARALENELEYPGQIKVTVIRESRAVDIAK